MYQVHVGGHFLASFSSPVGYKHVCMFYWPQQEAISTYCIHVTVNLVCDQA